MIDSTISSFPLIGLVLLLGLAIGSFLNVVIHRIPRGESVVRPGSRCPACGHRVRPGDNIPVIGYLRLRGRCRDCGAAISRRYPLVEMLTGIIFVAIAIKSGLTIDAALEAIFASAMIALIFTDAREQLLPDVITCPLLLFTLLAAAWRGGWGEPVAYPFDLSLVFATESETGFPAMRAAIVGGLLIAAAVPSFWLIDRLDIFLFNKYHDWQTETDSTRQLTAEEETAIASYEHQDRRMKRLAMAIAIVSSLLWVTLALRLGNHDPLAWKGAWSGLTGAVTGALVGALPLWWLRTGYYLVRGVEGLGLGDVKLMAGIGAFLGWQGALCILLISSIAGSLVGLWMMRTSTARLATAIPFGCFLGSAALAMLLKQIIWLAA